MFKCNICKYATKISSNYKIHTTTQSHVIAAKRNEEIQKKRRDNKIKKYIDVKNVLERIEKKQDEFGKKQDEFGKKQNEFGKKQKETNTGLKKITNYLDFLNTYCTDVEPIILLTLEEVDELLCLEKYKKYEFEEIIVKYIKNKKIYLKLGNLILKKFTNSEKPKEQRIWTSDISRLIYLIFRVIGKQKNWVRDKKGELFTELITTPIMLRIENLMKEYIKYMLSKFDKNNLDDIENIIYLDNAQTAEYMLSKFYTDTIKKEILKFIASKLSISLKQNDLLEEIY